MIPEELAARVYDIIRRSGVSDAEDIIRQIEKEQKPADKVLSSVWSRVQNLGCSLSASIQMRSRNQFDSVKRSIEGRFGEMLLIGEDAPFEVAIHEVPHTSEGIIEYEGAIVIGRKILRSIR